MKHRVVCDTNILISASLVKTSVPARALDFAELHGAVLYSDATLAELTRVLLRSKFARFIASDTVEELLSRIHRTWEKVTVMHRIQACRDPRDDMFLELAVGGQATSLITGDRDLLELGSRYRGVTILTPAAFLEANG